MKKNEIQMAQNNDFDGLVAHIQQTQDVLQSNARLVINRHVTAKAWLTGYYIVEYEQKGADRAKYGEQLLKKLAERLKDKKTFSYRSLRLYRQFYLTYQGLIPQVSDFVKSLSQIWQTPSAKLPAVSSTSVTIQTKPELLFNKLSFSHLSLLLPISDPLERAFYETMAIRGTWSVRELQRQKKMLIDDRYFKADLVFYHRILKRHVIIELKANRLNYADAAQLHMYLAYYRKNIMQPDDNPPIGILLCSAVGQEMAEYSLFDLDESVFISKYQLNVPSKERMTEFLRKENEGLYNKV